MGLASESNQFEALVSLVSRTQLRCEFTPRYNERPARCGDVGRVGRVATHHISTPTDGPRRGGPGAQCHAMGGAAAWLEHGRPRGPAPPPCDAPARHGVADFATTHMAVCSCALSTRGTPRIASPRAIGLACRAARRRIPQCSRLRFWRSVSGPSGAARHRLDRVARFGLRRGGQQ